MKLNLEPVPLFTVVRSGLMTTLQDLGRPGYERFGVATGGAMDPLSLRTANALVGNLTHPCSAALEMMHVGPELRANTNIVAAIAGADLGATVDGRRIEPGSVFAMERGESLSFTRRRTGSIAYLAVAGGFEVPSVMGSRSTFARAAFGGLEGRALRAGDSLIGYAAQAHNYKQLGWRSMTPDPELAIRPIRSLPGPHLAEFAPGALVTLTTSEYVVTHESDRMGYRLAGPPLERLSRDEMLSESSPLGAIQSPPGSAPIVLMADRQTTGGYPVIGVVISADIPAMAQHAPGEAVRFELVTLEEAHSAWSTMQRELATIETGVRLRGGHRSLSPAAFAADPPLKREG